MTKENLTTESTINLLANRRSATARELTEPGPDAGEIQTLMQIAARVPDHGKLAPWRFIVVREGRGAPLGKALADAYRQAEPEVTEQKIEKMQASFASSPVVVCVVSKAGDHPKIPEWEQVLSAGAVCQNLLVGAAALGFGAQWLTGWCAYSPQAAAVLGLGAGERVAGFIHLGTSQQIMPDRVRPALGEIITDWS
ncbi:MAG: nitroreductase family protein [Alphaproteobacteria bacterium]